MINRALEPTTTKFLNGEISPLEFTNGIKSTISTNAQNLKQIEFSNLMNKFVNASLDLLNHQESKEIVRYKLAGLIIFDCLIDINDEIMPERRIEISNHIFKVLESDKLSLNMNESILETAATSIGHFARVASSSEVEFLQNFSFPLALKLLRDKKSDSHKFSGALILTQLAQNSPALIFSKQRQVFSEICEIVSDKNQMVRYAASKALQSVLKVISQRESMAEYICAAFKQVEIGLVGNLSEKIIGALTILDTITDNSVLSLGEVLTTMRQYSVSAQDLIWKVLQRKDSKDPDVRKKVIDVLPNLARAFSGAFLQSNSYCAPNNFLRYTTKFLFELVLDKKERGNAFVALGRLHLALSSYFRNAENMQDLFNIIYSGLNDPFSKEALDCIGILVTISMTFRKLVDSSLVAAMFKGGLSEQLAENLKLVTKFVPSIRRPALNLLLRDIEKMLSVKSSFPDDLRKRGIIESTFKTTREKQKQNISALIPPQSKYTTEDIIFALKVLAEPEFFPKYYREKPIAASDEETFVLLKLLRNYILRFLDDGNTNVRKAATHSCIVILNTVCLSVDPSSEEHLLFSLILEKLLSMGVGDEATEIRALIFSSLTPILDETLSKVGNVYALIQALNDDNLNVRTSAMTVLARAARFDALKIMPIIRLELRNLITSLVVTQDHTVKEQCVRTLQALVKGANSLIIPYVEQLISPLLTLLQDSSPDVVAAAISTVGELALASPKSVSEHLDYLAPRVIDALNDQSSVIKQETAVIAMGKLVSSFSMVTAEPYKKYWGLFEGLVRAAQNADEQFLELRLQAIKTLGLLGVVDSKVYQHHLVCLNPARGAFTTSFTVEFIEDIDKFDSKIVDDATRFTGNESTKKLSQVERISFNLVIKELVGILRDSSLSHYHLIAAGIAVKTVRFLGFLSVAQLDLIIDSIFYRLLQPDSGNNIKEGLLDHIITLVGIMGSKMKSHNHQLLDIFKDYLSNYPQLCLDIFEAMALTYTTPDFSLVLRSILPFLSRCVEKDLTEGIGLREEVGLNDQISKVNLNQSSASRLAERKSVVQEFTAKVLQKLVNINDSLRELKKSIYPLVLMVLEHPLSSLDVQRDAILCLLTLSTDSDLQELAGRIVRAILRLFPVVDVKMQQIFASIFCSMVSRLGRGFLPFLVSVSRKLNSLRASKETVFGTLNKLDEFESLVSRLFKQRPLPTDLIDGSTVQLKADDRVKNRVLSSKAYSETTFHINLQSLSTAWALADRNSSSNLLEWMNRVSNEFIRQSPSSIIRSCALLANTYRPLAEALFNIAFYCIWKELFSSQNFEVVVDLPLVNGIEMALQTSDIPKNVMISLLNLAEFMDIHDLPLPLDIRLLARQAQSANMFAKCLRYRELEFDTKNLKPALECVDALITVCNQLGLGDRAIGVLRCLKLQYPEVDIQPQWLEKLCRWDDAFHAYEDQIKGFQAQSDYSPTANANSLDLEIGRLRCLHALGEHDDLLLSAKLLRNQIKPSDDVQEPHHVKSLLEVQRLGSYASWMLGKWETMEEFLEGETLPTEGKDVMLWNNLTFFKAVSSIHQQDYPRALFLINDIRNSLSSSITSLLSESYSRAYRAMVTMQILSEMEEVVEFKQMIDNISVEDIEPTNSAHNNVKEVSSSHKTEVTERKIALIHKWRGRLKMAPKDIDVYRQILAVHTLVTEPTEDLDSWMELVTMCRKEGMYSLCANLLRKLGAPLPSKKSLSDSSLDLSEVSFKTNDKVLLSTYQYWWSIGEKEKALAELTAFLNSCPLPDSLSSVTQSYSTQDATMFRVKCLLKKATWMRELEVGDVNEILETLLEARESAKDEYSVWHAWAVANYDQLKKAGASEQKPAFDVESSSVPFIPVLVGTVAGGRNTNKSLQTSFGKNRSITTHPALGSASLLNLRSIQQTDQITPFVLEAIKGFVRSIILGQGQPLANLLQDTLRLITLWFSYGSKKGVLLILESELEKISPDNWLSVIPQLIARIHLRSPELSSLLRKVLVKVAAIHPQALVWPISVALNTNDGDQKVIATEILFEMRKNRKQLVEEVTIVSRELMKVAITPHEMWYDGLEQAAQHYMDSKDIQSMLNTLSELHDTLSDHSRAENRRSDRGVWLGKVGTESLRDVSFRHMYVKSLEDAYFWLDQFRGSGRTADLHQAWEIYQSIFKKIKSQIVSLKYLELDHVSPALRNAKNLSLAVPGTYKPAAVDILISSFSANITVIASKQRPRRIEMMGSDGRRYQFLLKGHEDLRQDERVMQLFGLINACLNYDRITNDRGLNIVRYSVLPLSNNSGLIEWVQSCDTLNQLIKQYREENEIKLLTEMRLLQSKARNYDKLPLIHKVDVFLQVLQETSGEDLAKVFWLKSQTSDIWIERRANFTKSLAVMSMAGYILGLGDRHPSNLMIHKMSGQVVHIDFGDCFEITANRSKYPEIVPFRLTRMLTNCMGAAGLHGSYRLTCERVMRVLRDNRDSVMAMLEAFVYDPLISWRLLGKGDEAEMKLASHVNNTDYEMNGPDSVMEMLKDQPLANVAENFSSEEKMIAGTSIREIPPLRRSKSQEGIHDSEPYQEDVNTRALEVINRVQAKLTGRDFLKSDEVGDDFTVEQQVDRLIKEATSIENLCQLFSGWCPLW